jgi:hypothetical protein
VYIYIYVGPMVKRKSGVCAVDALSSLEMEDLEVNSIESGIYVYIYIYIYVCVWV